MRIKWNALAVSEAMDQTEYHLKKAMPHLVDALAVVRQAKGIPNLPDYMKQRLNSLDADIDWGIKGKVFASVERVRSDVPDDAVQELQKKAKQGQQTTLA